MFRFLFRDKTQHPRLANTIKKDFNCLYHKVLLGDKMFVYQMRQVDPRQKTHESYEQSKYIEQFEGLQLVTIKAIESAMEAIRKETSSDEPMKLFRSKGGAIYLGQLAEKDGETKYYITSVAPESRTFDGEVFAVNPMLVTRKNNKLVLEIGGKGPYSGINSSDLTAMYSINKDGLEVDPVVIGKKGKGIPQEILKPEEIQKKEFMNAKKD